MRLDQALVSRKLCESRTEAQELIDSRFVIVNGEVLQKKTRQVTDIDIIQVTGRRRFVSRGGEKIYGVLVDVYENEDVARIFCEAKTALDIGSSTGGFTDCLLQHGVTHVDAVDVGTAQLHPKIAQDTRVSIYENTDIRNFLPSTTYQIIVGDLSFISLDIVFEKILSFGTENTVYLLLIKPQFEVGKGNTKKGIVKDMSLVENILTSYKNLAIELGLQDVRIYPSRIAGGGGNQEYFLYGSKK